ncbi:12797_t:CDS:2, partial [Racocetra persica]
QVLKMDKIAKDLSIVAIINSGYMVIVLMWINGAEEIPIVGLHDEVLGSYPAAGRGLSSPICPTSFNEVRTVNDDEANYGQKKGGAYVKIRQYDDNEMIAEMNNIHLMNASSVSIVYGCMDLLQLK